jgi:AcrR family transcriptional regulator
MKKTTPQTFLNPRKTPVQRRSAETVEVVLEAAARILEARGFEGFNTNSIAERAGVSIGSFYQYFPNKDSLLAALMERESVPLLRELGELPHPEPFDRQFAFLVEAAVRHQMRRPALARLIDIAEKRATFEPQTLTVLTQLQATLARLLERTDAPLVDNIQLASLDLLAIIRALIDAAGERGDTDQAGLTERVRRAALGYLTGPTVTARG